MASEDEFLIRPTETLVSYLAKQTGRSKDVVEHYLHLGRLAMALEVITVAKIIEDHSIMAGKEETISVLQTLIVDQELMDDATEWYSKLCDWRRIKLETVDGGALFHRSLSSVVEDLEDVALPHAPSDVPPGNGRKTDPPSSE